MPYGRKSYRSARGRCRGTRKFTRKTCSRFSRKRFTKFSSKQKTVVAAPVNARETMVKLPWINTFASTSLTTGASSSRAFLGNSLVPFPAAYNSDNPAAGDEWVVGVAQYAPFYNLYRVLGSSIRVQLLCQTGTGVTFGVALVPVTVFDEGTSVDSSAEKIAELDALSYDAICMLPNVQSRIIGVGSGGNANVFMKMFRKTKAMLSVKDLKDVRGTAGEMPLADGSGGSIIAGASGDSIRSVWFYYVRVFNLTGSTGSFDCQVKMKFYVQMFGRASWTPVTVPA